MVHFLEQLLALALLFGGVWLGWHRWVKPHRHDMDAQAQGMVVLAILAVVGGLLGSPFWWLDIPGSFSWALPPLAARLLAAAGLAFGVTGCYALERRREAPVRAYIVMLAIYLGPLVAAIVAFHLDRFNWGAPITYAFFAVAGGMALAAVWLLVRGTFLGKALQDESPKLDSVAVRAWLWLVAIIAGLWGLAMFVYPQGPLPEIWIWPQDALTSRLIASMLLTLSAGGFLGLRSVASARMSLWMFVIYGVGAAAACFWNVTAGKPVPTSYAAAFCLLAPISLALLLIPSARAAAP